MGLKQWVFLPFLGGSEGNKKHHHGNSPPGRKFTGDGELTKKETAADFAGKGEEEIVQDYNAPISWWVVATLFPLIAGVSSLLGRCSPPRAEL